MPANSSKLFSFIFLTVKASANDPKSNNFLPKMLSDIQVDGHKLLPFVEDEWRIGTLGGTSGTTIADSVASFYQNFNQVYAIPYPKNKFPSIDLVDPKKKNKVSIEGLENAFITDFADYNYDESAQVVTAVIKMQFNYWNKDSKALQGKNPPPQLRLNTPFLFKQQLCESKDSDASTCKDPNGNPIDVIGTGVFKAEISVLNFNAKIKVSVEPEREGLDLSITNLSLATNGEDAPKFENLKVTLDDDSSSSLKDGITELIQNTLDSPDANSAIFKQMQNSLNSEVNISSISNTIKTQVVNFLNARLGAVKPGEQLPTDKGQSDSNMVDMYLFDRMRYSLNNTDSKWYVPNLMNSYKNPSLNPFKPGDLEIGSFDLFAGIKLTDVKLTNLVVNGFPNSTAPAKSMILSPPLVSVGILVGSLNEGTTATANFSGKYPGGALNFGLTIALKSIQICFNATPDGDDVSALNITFNSITIEPPTSSELNIKIDSSSDPMAPAVEKILNSPAIQNKIIAVANDQFKNHLSLIGTEVSKLIKDMLKAQIGGS